MALWGTLAVRADDAPLARAEKLLEDPSRAREALELLVKLPPAEKQSLDFHFLLASASCATGDVKEAAEALVTTAMLPANPARSFDAVRKKLSEAARESYRLALQEQASRNLTAAVKAYLIASKLDPATLGRDDKGLRDLALKGLAQAVAKAPERADHQYRLGFYTYLFGRPEESLKPFEAATKLQADPYLKWKNQLWLTRVQREVDEVRQAELAEQKKRKAKSSPVYLPRTGAGPASEDTVKQDKEKEKAAYIRDLEERIAQVDAEIKYRENLKPGPGYTYNFKKVNANLERYRELKKQLEFELANLK